MKLLLLPGTPPIEGAPYWLYDSLRLAFTEAGELFSPGPASIVPDAIVIQPGAEVPDAYTGTPVCGIHHGTHSAMLPHPRTLSIVFTNNRRTNELLFMPEEFITELPACPYVPLHDMTKSSGRHICFSTEGIAMPEVVRMIAGLNLQRGLTADILVSSQSMQTLAEQCNPHIRVRPFAEAPAALALADVLIGGGQWCIEGLFRRIPVIVVGSHGFGGLVTTENIRRHIHYRFGGRFGGVPEEQVPFSLVAEELARAGLTTESGDRLLQALFTATHCVGGITELAQFLRGKITGILDLNRKISRPHTMAALKPKMVSDILLNTDPGNGCLLLHKNSGKIIASVDEDISGLLHSFDGSQPIASLGSDGSGQLEAFIAELWSEKLICFNPATD